MTLSHLDPTGQTYVTLGQAAGAQRLYAPIIVTPRGRRPAPINIRRHTLRNVLSMAMSYASAKGLPFRLEAAHSDLATEASAVQAELAERHGIEVEVR
mgnify:CR=1 FL=1